MKIHRRLLQFFSLAVVVLLFVSLAILVRQLQKPQFTAPRAATGATPKDVRLTNLTENSVAVSWITDDKVAGIIKYGIDASQLDKTGSEDDGRTPSSVHHITLKPLKPETGYYFRIQSGQSVFDDSGNPFTITTPKVISTPPPPQTVYGSILSALPAEAASFAEVATKAESAKAGALADRAIVYVDIPNSSTPLSALVNPDSGNWSVSISTVRAAGQDHYLAVADSTVMKIFVQGGSQGTSTAAVKLKNAAPIPPISLNQTYAFDQRITNELSEPITNNFLPTPTEVNLAVTNVAEGQTLTDTSPTFIGTAPPAVKITITIQSPTSYSADITVKPDGSWSWTPPADLTPGSHTITISYTDESGKTHTETKTFLVQSASNTLNTPNSPIFSPSPIPTITEQQLPAAGNSLPSIILILVGISILSSGVLLFSKSSLPASS